MQEIHSLGTHCLASRGVRRHKDRLIVINTQDGLPLERVKNKRIFLQFKQDRFKKKSIKSPLQMSRDTTNNTNYSFFFFNICVEMYLGCFPHPWFQWFILVVDWKSNLERKDRMF